MKMSPSQKRFLFLTIGAFAAVGAFIPCPDLKCPPPVRIDRETAALPELLSLPGVGLKRASAIRELQILKEVEETEGEILLPAYPSRPRLRPFLYRNTASDARLKSRKPVKDR